MRAVRPLVAHEQARWTLSLYPTAGEAGGAFVSARRHRWVAGGAGADPDRARAEAARRARAKVRRYCAANLLNRFGTLTYGPPRCTDPAQLRDDLGGFFRSLRTALGGSPLPYVWVPEWHKDGEHLHAHFALARFVPRDLIASTWDRGFIDIRLRRGVPVGASPRDEARGAAKYLAKYVGKTFDHPHLFGRHRYDVAQGFQPQAQRLTGRTSGEVLDQACEVMGAAPERAWSSAEVEDWDRPPAVWFSWA